MHWGQRDSSNIPTVTVSFPLWGLFPESSRASSLSVPTAHSPPKNVVCHICCSSAHPQLIHLITEQSKLRQHRLTPPWPLTSGQTPALWGFPPGRYYTLAHLSPPVSMLHSIHSYSCSARLERTLQAQCETMERRQVHFFKAIICYINSELFPLQNKSFLSLN